METTNRQLFFSHTWKYDNLNRNNHNRVCQLAQKLNNCGWSTWIDEENLIGNIDAGMATGIDNAEAMIVCLTDAYCRKVNETAKDPRKRDNCLKEWTYGNARNKLMIPVVMEPDLLDMTKWPPGVVSLYFGSTLYVDGSKDNLNNTVINIHKILQQHGLKPTNTNNTNTKTLSELINQVNNILHIEPSLNNNYKNKSKRTLLNYLIFNRKIFETNIRRHSNPPVLTKSSNRLYNMHRKWKSTGNIQEITI